MTTSSYSLAPGETPEGLALRRKLAAQMLQQGGDTSPVQHWTQGLARLVQGGLGGYQLGQISRDEDADKEAGRQAMLSLLGGNPPTDITPQHPLGPVTSGPRPPTAPPATAPDATVPIGTTLDQPAVPSSWVDRTINVESGNDPNARNPRSSAGGAGQFIDSTWLQTVRANRPDLAGRPDAELLALKSDKNLSRDMTSAYARENGATLQGAGLPVTAGSTYLAHFAGPQGAVSVMRADPNTPVGQVLGAKVLAANPFLQGMTTGDLVQWANRKMAGAGGPPQGSGMPIGAPPSGAPPAPPAVPMGASAAQPQITPQQRAQITSLLGNRFTAPMAQQMITALAQRNIMPTDPKFEKIKDENGAEIPVWADPRTRTIQRGVVPEAAPVAGSVIPPVLPGIDPKEWRKQYSERLTGQSMPAKPEAVSALRKEIQDIPSYKNLAQSAPVYRSMLEAAGRDNRAADVNLIYGMAKLMDPGSVVRESEMTVAQAIATLPQNLQAQIKSQLAATGRLDPDVRADLMREAHSRVRAYQGMFDTDASMFRQIAKDNRMNEAHVIPNFGTFEEYKPPERPAAPPAPPAPQRARPPVLQNLKKKYNLE